MNDPQTPYEILGDDGIRTLVDAFYDAMDTLPEAADVRAMHAENLDPIKSKLAAYLTGWMGGPPVYLAMTGTVCLTDPHSRYAIGPEERDQWLRCMEVALERIGATAELRQLLREPLFRVADAVRNRGASKASRRDSNIIAVG